MIEPGTGVIPGMMNGKGIVLAVALALTPGLLFAARVKVDFEKSTDFSKYKTYAWGEGAGGRSG